VSLFLYAFASAILLEERDEVSVSCCLRDCNRIVHSSGSLAGRGGRTDKIFGLKLDVLAFLVEVGFHCPLSKLWILSTFRLKHFLIIIISLFYQ